MSALVTYILLSCDGKTEIPAPASARLGVVAYRGQGKYAEGTDFWFYDELPSSRDEYQDFLNDGGLRPPGVASAVRDWSTLRHSDPGRG